MQELHGAAQESLEIIASSVHAHAGLRPQRVIEYDEHFRKCIEHGQPVTQTFLARVAGIARKFVHDGLRLATWHVVYADMKDGACEWNAPFHRNRWVRCLPEFLQQLRRFNRVVVGERDQALQSERNFDLIPFRLVG